MFLFLSPNTDPPTIISLTYEEENCTLICVSTGSPPTVVSWMKDGENITIDRHHFSLSQTITDRASSTYNNILTVGEGVTEGVAGVYNCTVSNVLGSDSTGITAVGEWNIRASVNVGANEISRDPRRESLAKPLKLPSNCGLVHL